MTNQIKNQQSAIENRLGEPLPASRHAVSVSLPKWADVKGYEEGELRVINAMKMGYPRFVYHPQARKLFAEAERKFATANEFCLVLPSERIAELGRKFCGTGRVEKFHGNLHALVLPKGMEKEAKYFWQHPGFIISSREAEDVLNGKTADDLVGDQAKLRIRQNIAGLSGEGFENVYLFPSGMAAIFTAFEVVTSHPHPAAGTVPLPLERGRIKVGVSATIQLGFPYVDTLKIQQKFGRECFFVDYKDEASLAEVEKLIKEKNVTAVFTEFPCNPLITCVELETLSKICRANNVALVIDDTLATWANVDLRPFADIIVTSLTKFFSGVGDVLAGLLILNSDSPLHEDLTLKLGLIYEDLLYSEDALVLNQNSRDFDERIFCINNNAEALADWLLTRPEIKRLYYTKGNPVYEKYMRQGYGGVMSLDLGNEDAAQKFFDALEINKGPSLGTNYTLACPYTMLAHYTEREFAESANVPFHLIRVSVGLEDFEELKNKFEKALEE